MIYEDLSLIKDLGIYGWYININQDDDNKCYLKIDKPNTELSLYVYFYSGKFKTISNTDQFEHIRDYNDVITIIKFLKDLIKDMDLYYNKYYFPFLR